ncbi:MAG: hypothetical protein WBW92_11465, partial [Rhodanobacteraceae bacterium]
MSSLKMLGGICRPSGAVSNLGVRRLLSMLAGLILALLTMTAWAEGSRSLYPASYPAGGFRADLDLSNSGNLYAGVAARRQFLYVYAKAGEFILLGSSNRANGGDILVYDPQSFGTKADETVPGSADFSCSASTPPTGSYSGAGLGTIAARANELAGPNSADNSVSVGVNGYAPCAYKAPVTGIYGVLFTVATSGGNGPTGSIDTLHVGNNTVAAWEVQVRASATSITDINARLFTYAWVGYTAGNSRPVYHTLYYVTPDGSRYRQDMQGLDPNGYALWGSTAGFLDNGQPLYKDIRGDGALVDNGVAYGAGQELTAQQPQSVMFFSTVDASGANATEADTVLTALGIPLVPPPPQVANPQFNGLQSGNTTYVGGGGTFTFNAQSDTSYQIVISANGTDFDPGNTSNVTLTGLAPDGLNSVQWNGLANDGSTFPPGSFTFKIVGRNGEIHFPIIDTEGNANGGPTLTRLNGIGAPDSTVFYDDRGYTTLNGQTVGTLNGLLCSSNPPVPPTPDHSLLGVDSSASTGGVYYRDWPGNGNSNSDCSSSAGFGDAKAIDLWTYQQTPVETQTIVIVDSPSNAQVATSVNVPPTALPGATVNGSFSFQNVGTTTANGVTYTAVIGTPGNCPTGLAFGLVPPGVTFTYNASTCEVTLSNMPGTLNAGQSLDFNFSYTAPPSGQVPVTTTINSTDGGSDSANGVTVISPQDITLAKTAPATVAANGALAYSIALGNNGGSPSAATLTVTDTLPTGVTYVGAVAGTNVNSVACSGTTTLTCTVNLTAVLAAGAPNGAATFTINTTAPATLGDITNYASVDHTGSNSPPPPGPACAPAASCGSATTTVNAAQNITLVKTGPATAVVNGSVVYTIGLGNSGGSPSATTLTVSDVLPAGVTYQSAAAGTNVTTVSCTGTTTLTCTVNLTAAMAAGAPNNTTAFTITATAPATGGDITNYASVDPSGGATPPTPGASCTPATSCGSATTTINAPQLAIIKTATPNPFVVGQAASYTITVTNTGTAATTATSTINDTIPTGLTIGSLPSGCTNPSGQNVQCTIASGLAASGGSQSFTIPVTVTSTATTGDNTAYVVGGGDPNCTGTNCPGTVTVPVNSPQLAITKTATPNPFVVGQAASYTITVTNTGTAATTATSTINDAIPTGLTIGSLPSGCTNPGGQNVQCTIASGLAASGGSQSFTIPVTPTASASNGNNTAYVTGGGDPNCTGTNCPGTVTVPVVSPKLTITKTATPNPFVVGQSASYTITVT